jgi:hypothetical protein
MASSYGFDGGRQQRQIVVRPVGPPSHIQSPKIYRHKVIFDKLDVDAIDSTTSRVAKNAIFYTICTRCRASAVPTRMIVIQKPFPRERFLLEIAGVGVRGSALDTLGSVPGVLDQRQNSFFKVRSEAIRRVKEAFDQAGVVMPEPV